MHKIEGMAMLTATLCIGVFAESKGEHTMSRKSKVTLARVIRAVEEDDCKGFCTACGAEAYNVEPDAREYACESCGERKVFGAEELLFTLAPVGL